MRATGRSLIFLLLFLPFVSLFQNCSKVSFNSTEASDSVDGSGGPTCTVDMVTTNKTVKILFLMDASGSNQSNNNATGTDVNKVWRLKTINAFLSAYQGKSNFEFGFAYFKDGMADSLIKEGTKPVFSRDSTTISNAINDFKAVVDKGSTPYDKGLAVVKSMISNDQVKNASSKNIIYVVVMVSDGVPKDSPYMNANGMDLLASDVQSIMNVASGQISMNTVYLYNAQVPSASEKIYLQKISSVGKGTFVEASSQSSGHIEDTVSVPREVCTQ